MNLNNKKRISKDIIVYENFINDDVAEKIIQILNKHAESGNISWIPISF